MGKSIPFRWWHNCKPLAAAAVVAAAAAAAAIVAAAAAAAKDMCATTLQNWAYGDWWFFVPSLTCYISVIICPLEKKLITDHCWVDIVG